MRTMTELDRCWIDCINLWKWVSKWWLRTGISVVTLKTWWCWLHPFKSRRASCNRCFFCAFSSEKKSHTNCGSCPGQLVDPKFTCMAKEYHHETAPDKFCAELIRLNKLRLRKESETC